MQVVLNCCVVFCFFKASADSSRKEWADLSIFSGSTGFLGFRPTYQLDGIRAQKYLFQLNCVFETEVMVIEVCCVVVQEEVPIANQSVDQMARTESDSVFVGREPVVGFTLTQVN